MRPFKLKPSWLLMNVVVFGTAAVLVYLHTKRLRENAPRSHIAPPLAASATQTTSAPVTAPVVPVDPILTDACDALRKASDSQTIRQQLAELRQKLEAMPTKDAVRAIRQFLDSKADASIGLGFKLASNGMLDEAPTLRTFLLDELGRINPAAAADYAKVVLASMDSPDEWAVALRDLALGDSSADGLALLNQKTAQMLQYAPWQQNPSAGFLEAFDVPVYLGGTNFVPTLTDLVRSQDNPAVAHAAFLALDRLVINNPASVLESLEDDPDSMEGRESTRADYFARADAGDLRQRQLLENYLLDPAISPAELQTFAAIFPNANYMISPNLLTQANTPDHATLANRDAQALAVAQQWLNDPAFANVAPELQTITQRLQGFAAQAKRGP